MEQNSFEKWKDAMLTDKLRCLINDLELLKRVNIGILMEKETYPTIIKAFEKGCNTIIDELYNITRGSDTK